MTLIHFCKLSNIWYEYKTILYPPFVTDTVGHLDESCQFSNFRVMFRAVLSTPCQIFLGWSAPGDNERFYTISEDLCFFHLLAARLIFHHSYCPHLQIRQTQGKAYRMPWSFICLILNSASPFFTLESKVILRIVCLLFDDYVGILVLIGACIFRSVVYLRFFISERMNICFLFMSHFLETFARKTNWYCNKRRLQKLS